MHAGRFTWPRAHRNGVPTACIAVPLNIARAQHLHLALWVLVPLSCECGRRCRVRRGGLLEALCEGWCMFRTEGACSGDDVGRDGPLGVSHRLSVCAFLRTVKLGMSLSLSLSRFDAVAMT
jgi:hypothetical protein